MAVVFMFATATLTFAQGATVPPIGVGWVSSETACMALDSAEVAAGTMVTLIDPSGEEPPAYAAVDGRVTTCRQLERGLVPGPYHRLTPPRSEAAYSLRIAVVGRIEANKSPTGSLTFYLNAAYPRAQVRDCASREGAHLTVWESVPLESRRLWHQYFYLGFDVEPTCSEADRADAPPDIRPQ